MADKNRSLLFGLFSDASRKEDPATEVTEPKAEENLVVQDSVSTAQLAAQEKIAELLNQEEVQEVPVRMGKELIVEDEYDEEGNPLPIDARIRVRIAPNNMEAYLEAWGPRHGGSELGPRAIRSALSAAGVTYGILDRAIMEAAMNKPYGKGEVLMASGTPKEDGVDAFITENFSREQELTPFKNSDGTVDFKKLNVVREIREGTVIATLTLATPGSDGVNVKGEPVKAMAGKPKQLLRGSNTVISEDGLKLTASANGHLSFTNDRFNVDSTFVVEGSVDNNTGNITFIGDVLVKGDVREGYEIRSTAGGIRVKGTVEGASLYAEKDIHMDGGFNGMKRGEVSSQTNILSKFLQNCTVYAKEGITSEAIINSVVECDGTISVVKGKGTIVGGKVTALHSVEANTIGSDVNTPTNITVGLSPTVVAEKLKLERELKDVEESKEALHKNLIYLERCTKMGALSPKNLALVDSCNKQKVLNLVRESKCTRRLAEVNATIEEAVAGSFVKSKVTYPSTKISIQAISFITKDVYNRSIFRKQDGEIKIATF